MSENGKIKISNDVIAVIAAIAATDTKGVVGMSGGVVDGIVEMIGKKTLSKGVRVEAGDEECSIDVYIIVEYGHKIMDVAKHVQINVSKAVISLTGLKVNEVNICVQGINIPEKSLNVRSEDKNLTIKG